MRYLAIYLAGAGLAALSAGAAAAVPPPGQPVIRWSVDGMRANRLVRPNDLYIKPPVRTYRKVRPTQKPRLEAPPTYGQPRPAIERIPQTGN